VKQVVVGCDTYGRRRTHAETDTSPVRAAASESEVSEEGVTVRGSRRCVVATISLQAGARKRATQSGLSGRGEAALKVGRETNADIRCPDICPTPNNCHHRHISRKLNYIVIMDIFKVA